ncbi:DMT family transporter [Poseidonocella pacifica]|nr:DMT family transporter [Poseidonocella pacifica]
MGRTLLLMFIAMSLIPGGDTAGKMLTAELGVAPVFAAFVRFALGALLVLPFLRSSPWPLLADWRVWLRGVLLACGIASILTALRTEPMANCFAAFFIGPLVSYALSVFLLRETVTPLRTLLVVLGFLGVLIVVRPGLGGSPNLLFAVLAGLFYGGFLTASRWLTGLARPRALLFSQLVIGAVVTAPFALLAIPPIDASTAGLLATSATLSMLGNLLLLVVYTRATAAQVAPLVYFQLIAATGFGWLVFGDLPDALTVVGLAVIVGAGILSATLGRGRSSAPFAPRPDRG